MPSRSARWRQFHTDELRTIYSLCRICTHELTDPISILTIRLSLCDQLRAELAARGVPATEMVPA